MNPGELALFGTAFAVVFFSWLWSYSRRPTAQSRRAAAPGLGLEYLSEGTREPPTTEFMPVLWNAAQTSIHYMFRNSMSGRVGSDSIWLFDLDVIRQGHGDAMMSSQTVVLIKTGGGAFPVFKVIPWKAAAEKSVDIDLPFLKTHTLIAESKGPVADMFLKAGSGFLRGETGWAIEGGGQWLVFCRHDKLIPSLELKAFLEDALRLRGSMLSAQT